MTEVYHKRQNKIDESNVENKLSDDVEEETNEQIPLEMMGVIRAVRKYALQTSAIGMTIGIDELIKIEEIIRNLQPHENGLQTILHHVEERQKILKETFRQAYKL